MEEEKAVSSGGNYNYVVTRTHNDKTVANTTRVITRYASGDKLETEDDRSLDSLAFKYFKIPKHDRDAQLKFFMLSMLLLATSILIVSSCGCLFFYLFSSIVKMQQRMVH